MGEGDAERRDANPGRVHEVGLLDWLGLLAGGIAVGMGCWFVLSLHTGRDFPLPVSLPLVILCGGLGGSELFWIIPGAAFMAWTFGLCLRSPRVPRRSIVLAALCSVASVWWYWSALTDLGEAPEGSALATLYADCSAVGGAVSWTLLWVGRRRENFWLSLAAHAALFLWLFTAATPLIMS